MPAQKQVTKYISWLRQHKKPGDTLLSNPAKIECPADLHKPTVTVWMSTMAGAGLLKSERRGVYTVTRDLILEDEQAVVDLYFLYTKRDRSADPGYRHRNRTGKPRVPVASPPEPDPEVEIDVVDTLKQLGFAKSLTALQSLHDELLSESTGEQTKAELEKVKNEAAYLRSQNQTLEHTLQALRSDLKDSRAKALQLQTDLNLARQGVQRMAERKVFVPLKHSDARDHGASQGRASGHITGSRPVVMKKIPRSVSEALRRKRDK